MSMEAIYSITLAVATEQTTNVYRTEPRQMDGRQFDYDIDQPQWFHARIEVPTIEEAQALAARFPKSLRVKGSGICDGLGKSWGVVKLEASMSPDGVNKGANETGIRRVRGFFKACAKLGIVLEYSRFYGNSSPKTAADYGWAEVA